MGYDYTFEFSWIRPNEESIGLSNCTATLFGSNISLEIWKSNTNEILFDRYHSCMENYFLYNPDMKIRIKRNVINRMIVPGIFQKKENCSKNDL